MTYWLHNEDSDLCYKRKGAMLNSSRGVVTTSRISVALLRGEPAYYADGHHFEGVAIVEFFRRDDVWTVARIREEETGDTLYLDEAAVEAATKEAQVMLDAVLTGYREECERGDIYQGGKQ